MVFIDDSGHQLFCIERVYIGLCFGTDLPRLSPGEFISGYLMFGDMMDLSTSPPTRYTPTIWRRVPVDIILTPATRLHDYATPPRHMLHFDTTTAVRRPHLDAARQVLGYTGGSTNHNYYTYRYIGNLLYCFEFAPERTRENIILAAPLRTWQTSHSRREHPPRPGHPT